MSDGLAGISAAETVLSQVDAQKGLIWVRGVPLSELVERYGYEAAVALLWEDFVAKDLDGGRMRAMLGAGRAAAFERLEEWLDGAAHLPIAEAMRVCLASLSDDSAPEVIAGALPVGVAALLRARAKQPLIAPDPSLSTAADLLRMMRGSAADDRFVRVLDTYFTTVVDNGLSSSTFAGRVIASTHAPLPAAVTGAYCAFTGPLHGGAPGPVLDMLDTIQASGDVKGWIERHLASGKRLMGFGSRVFRIRDPRADILREALQRLGPEAGRLAFAAEVEREALAALARRKPDISIQSNIELNAALLLEAVGVPRDAFTAVFSVARIPSWIAHALEQQKSGRMIRPTSTYVGPDLAG